MRNPKEQTAEYLRQINSRYSPFGSAYDPIGEEIRDTNHNKYYLNGFPVVPFSHQGEVNIQLINKMVKLSPTNGSIIKRKHRFTLGGQWTVTRRKPETWAEDDDLLDVSKQEKVQKREWVRETFGAYDAIHVPASKGLTNYLDFGNAFFELQLHRVGGRYYARLYSHDFDRCLYMATEPREPKVVLISPFWYHLNISGNDHVTAIPLYPNFVEDEDGVLKTMFHLKNDVPGRSWYGEPEWLECLYYAYLEIMLGEFEVNGYGNDWTPRVFIETYDLDDDEIPPTDEREDLGGNPLGRPDGFGAHMDSFYTNQGRVRRKWIHRATSPDATPSSVHQFKGMDNHDFHKISSEIARSNIIVAHDWHNGLMMETPGKLGGSQIFEEAFRAKYYTVIQPLEDMMLDMINKILRIVAEFQGNSITDELSVGLVNLYSHMLIDPSEEMKQEEAPATNDGPAPDDSQDLNPEGGNNG